MSFPCCLRFAVVAGPSFFVSFLGVPTLGGPLAINSSFDPSFNRHSYLIDILYWDRCKNPRVAIGIGWGNFEADYL